MRRIVIAGAFDTKALPLGRLIAELEDLGQRPIVIDTSVFSGERGCDYGAAAVAAAAGHDIAALPELGRAKAVGIMAEGAARIVEGLCRRDEMGALVCMGGSNAGVIFARLNAVIPIGVPKILMATAVAGETRPFVDASDVILIYPIVDIEGDNGILNGMIGRAARTAVAALSFPDLNVAGNAGRAVGLTMFGVTTPCVARCRDLLAAQGLEGLVFHANGMGGKSLERFVAQGFVSSLLDVTITELADELFGGWLPAGADRLTNAARKGLPQVLAPGAIDMINFGPLASVPEHYRKRRIVSHNELVTLVRTTPEENYRLGVVAAERLAGATAPTVMMIPLRGVSMLDREGQAFHDPGAVKEFAAGFRATAADGISTIDLDLHINDPKFAERLVAKALEGRRAMGI